MDNAYLAAFLACNPNAGALMGNHSNSISLEDSSSSSTSLSTGISDIDQVAASLNSELHAARNSALLSQILQQRQIDEFRQQQQQRSLLASLTGGGTVSAPVTDNAVFLALLHKKQQQDQQALQQKQLQELQACMGLATRIGSSAQQHSLLLGPQESGQYFPVGDRSSEILAAAGLTGLSSTQQSQFNSNLTSSYASLLAAQQQQLQHQIQQVAQHSPVFIGGPVQSDARRKGRSGKFPHKLHQMLSDLEQQGRSDIASFMPHGCAFAIHKPTEFTKDVMHRYFRMSRFSSFQRQLNLYDFQRISEGHDKGSYFHKLFIMGQAVLCSMMKRNKIKGKGVKLLQKNSNTPKKPTGNSDERKPSAGGDATNGGDDDEKPENESRIDGDDEDDDSD